MNTALKALLFLGGGFVIYTGLRVLAVQQMTFSIANVDLSHAGIETTAIVTISVENPTSWTNTIHSFQAQALINGSPVGLVSLAEKKTVAEKATTMIPVEVKVNDLSILASIASLVLGGSGKASLELKGDANVNRIPFPVDLTYEIG